MSVCICYLCIRKGHIVADCDVKTNVQNLDKFAKFVRKSIMSSYIYRKKPKAKITEKSIANVNHTYVKRFIDEVTDESDSDDQTSEQQESEEHQEKQD